MLEVSQADLHFRTNPHAATLLQVHLACRDLKSQLVRYRGYFGTVATHQLKQAVLPVIESVLAAVKQRENAGLTARNVAITLETAQACRQVLTAERFR